MTRTALILAAHGSQKAPAANAVVRALAERVRTLGLFDEVTAAFHRGEPGLTEVLDQIAADDATIVPIMTSAGYYSEVVLPRDLASNDRFGQIEMRITAPIGTHPKVAAFAAARFRKACERFGFDPKATRAAVVGHGTPRHPGSRLATEAAARRIERLTGCRSAAGFFLEEAPAVETVVDWADGCDVVVIPFLIGGSHVMRDIPRRLGIDAAADAWRPFRAEVDGVCVVCDRAVGEYPGIAEVVVALARTGGGRSNDDGPRPVRELRLGTRGSALARWQAEHVAERLRSVGVAVRLVEVSTVGDRVLDCAIQQLPTAGPFSDDIERLLLAGEIDLAVHSLKDLPLRSTPGLRVVAVLPRGDAGDVLVSRSGLTLAELPAGVVVGTSSPRRAAQLLALRPDLRTAIIRGPVDARIRQVHAGRFDAALLARAGLERLGLSGKISEDLSIEAMLPAPGQAALAVQVRSVDAGTAAICRFLNDAATQQATAAELAFARAYEDQRGLAVAAFATADERITLHARLISLDGSRQRDARIVGDDPIETAGEAIRRLGGGPATAEVA
ncbi:MAG: hydroxymethylbilane synthase [Phycisphaerae bacterium]